MFWPMHCGEYGQPAVPAAKAILLPSGDHAGLFAHQGCVSGAVSFCTPEPSASAMYTSQLSHVSDVRVKAGVRPPGDQAGPEAVRSAINNSRPVRAAGIDSIPWLD